MKSLLLFAALVAFVNGDLEENCGFAPLCGSSDVEFDWQTGVIPDGVEGEVILGAELNFQDCCKLKDTVPQEECQIVDPTGESYRTLTATEPICGDGGEDCTEGSCEEYQLVLNPVFLENSQNDACCDSCTCFGDPQCVSFSGEEKIWILCDGRDVPHEDSIFDMCRITESQCLKEKDHAGNQCVYLAEDGRGRDWTVGKQGSPCQPNPESPTSAINMYSVPDAQFALTLEQGERGIIEKVVLSLECGEFELTAADCMAQGRNAWSFSGVDSLPEFFSYNDVVLGYDEHWSVVDPFSGISVAIRCHANHYEGDTTAYVPRINVEDLSDPVPRGRNNADGFCVTSEFDTGSATTSNSDKIFSRELCTEGLQDSDVRNIYRALCKNPGLPSSAHESCIYHFCLERYSPLFSSVEECQNVFSSSLKEGFCGGVTYSEKDKKKCEEQWDDLGAVETITQYYDDEKGCTSEIQTSLNKCQSGVVLQFFRNNQWNDAVAIPSDFCADQGPVLLSYCDYRYLFNRRIRILQKTASIECGPVNQCQTVEGLIADIALNKNTPFPTSFPTDSPTNAPTDFPTPFPVSPTEFPTPFPDTPTAFPTLFPSFDATVTPPCPEEPLCGTEEEYIPYDADDEFHLDMEECCPTRSCPGFEDEEKERIKGVDTWYCGLSDGADGTVGDSHTQMECEDNWELTVQVMFSNEEECCKKCTCYGDPRCISFDGTFEEFILCDGRTIPGSESTDERCIIRKETCEAQRDHEGNACKWSNPMKSPPDFRDEERQEYEESQYQVSRYGSPCRYDQSESGAAMVLMYSLGESYVLEVEQGERGYIQSVHLTTEEAVVELSAEKCLNGDDWDVVSGETEHLKFSRSKYGMEYVWTVVETVSEIELRIRCTGHVYNNKFSTSFINVEALLEPDEDRIDSAGGFCATNEMREKELATVGHTEDIRAGGYCDFWNEDSSEIVQREVARIITNNPGVTNVGVETAYREFCRTFFSPGWSSVSKCVNAFTSSSNVKSTMKSFCRAVTLERGACEENLEILAETGGYKEAFHEAYETYVLNFEQQCEVKFGDLPSAITQDKDGCNTGVELQFYNPRRGKWVTYAAFPENSACSGYTVQARYEYHPKLFKNQLRLVQRHHFGHCSSCTYTSNVMGWFTFKQEPDNTF